MRGQVSERDGSFRMALYFIASREGKEDVVNARRAKGLLYTSLCLLIGACGDDGKGNATLGDGGAGGGQDAGASDDTGDASSPGGDDPDLDPGVSHARPPAPGAKQPAAGGSSLTFAISRFYFGDAGKDAWTQYGYDVDGKVSSASSTDLCKPREHAPERNVYPDGVDGRDNSYGRNVLPILLALDPDALINANKRLDAGRARPLFSFPMLGFGTDYNPLKTLQYQSLALGAIPRYDGTDRFPIDPAALINPADVNTPKTEYASAYMVGDTWVSGPLAANSIAVPFLSGNITIAQAEISMEFSPDRRHVTKGVISGVISLDEFYRALQRDLPYVDTSFCELTATFDSISQQINQAADILGDGSQDPTMTCDGISIGLGFDAEPVQLGSIENEQPAPDPCDIPL